MNLVPSNSSLTMTSREIAELTGKELSHVHRDIRVLLDELKKDDPELNHPQEDKDSRGYTTCFYLSRELTETLSAPKKAARTKESIRDKVEVNNWCRKVSDTCSIFQMISYAQKQDKRLLQYRCPEDEAGWVA